jgi:hypothetical protein
MELVLGSGREGPRELVLQSGNRDANVWEAIMNAIRLTLTVALVLAALAPADCVAEWSVSVDYGGLFHTLSVDERAYWLGDTVHISYSVTNTTEDTIFLDFGCLYHALFVDVYDPSQNLIWRDPAGCQNEIWFDLFEPGEIYSKVTQWDMYSFETHAYIDEPGTYTVMGRLKTLVPEHAHSVSLAIEIGDSSTIVPEPEPGTWGRIKSLYRQCPLTRLAWR